ncbi:hypothetical protein Acr_08g0014250 [Actinidia rufa]|uniref:AP2/B3-like transcriptional factor family protein n=1 Tax=Actinidia rufa TaxID=165716 RepID=A0A7J0F458_9ERIC|nr:hypothetical protein Acr_08g0014250 [Actinidia rufa]
MRLTPSDIEKGRLSIPVEKALDLFPPLANRQKTYEEEAEISDTENNYKLVTITYDRSECAFLIKNSLWQRFVHRHGLRVKDVIRFYRPNPFSRGQNRYLVDFVKRGQENEADNVPEFKQDNFLFELPLTSCDIWYRRLVIPKAEVGIHFPGIRVPAETHKMERLNFTDKHNKSWCIKIVFNGHLDSYMLINGWEGLSKTITWKKGVRSGSTNWSSLLIRTTSLLTMWKDVRSGLVQLNRVRKKMMAEVIVGAAINKVIVKDRRRVVAEVAAKGRKNVVLGIVAWHESG